VVSKSSEYGKVFMVKAHCDFACKPVNNKKKNVNRSIGVMCGGE
jgi:hypothetical protein